MALTLCNAQLITPAETFERGTVAISSDGKIAYAGPSDRAPACAGEGVDLAGRTIIPGFLDIHTHGGGGVAFGASNDPAGEMRAYSEWVARGGVTGFLCTLAAPNADMLLETVRAFGDALDAGTAGAEALGIHLEGPYLNPEQRGAFPAHWLRPPDLSEAESLVLAGRGWIRMVTMAPELPGAMEIAQRFRQAGIVVALGHTNADYETTASALQGPFAHVTHAFNAMSGFHHRAPGTAGAVLASDNATAELVADGIHVHPATMRVLLRSLGKERVVLITDSAPWASLSDGEYEWAGGTVTLRAGRATLPSGALAGSVATMDTCVRNVSRLAGISLPDAVRMATLNPVRLLGLHARLGRIAAGMDADLAILDLAGTVEMTVCKGKWTFRRDS